MTALKIIVIIVAITTALAARKQLIDVLDELKELDDNVLRRALSSIPDASDIHNTTAIVKAVESSENEYE